MKNRPNDIIKKLILAAVDVIFILASLFFAYYITKKDRTYVAHISATYLAVFYAYKRRIVGIYAPEDTGVCLPVDRFGMTLQRCEMDGKWIHCEYVFIGGQRYE